MRKSLIFGQKPWIIPFGKCRWFALFKSLFFWSKNHPFFSRISKTNLLWPDFFQKTQIKKISIFGPKPWIIPLGKCPFFQVFKLKFSGLKFILFYPEYRETIFSNAISSKTLMRKSFNFGEKKILRKDQFFGAPQNVTFLV